MEPTDLDVRLLEEAGISSSISKISPLKGGANNRVYKIELEDASSLVLKQYFSHPQDLRPRLKAEYEFLSFAWNEGVRSIPQPLAQDPSRNRALYSYVDGSPATNSHANREYVEEAIAFLIALNKNRSRGNHLGCASESSFQFADSLAHVERRIDRLKNLSQDSPPLKLLHKFINDCLIPAWNECKTALHPEDPPVRDRILSPSDFGLHNTIFSMGKPIFIDFEYAGWDDPAKTICDFFLQPKFSIPMSFFALFSEAAASMTRNPSKTLERTQRLFSISKIKWCCIILNVFSNTGKSRRDFADHPHVFETQLELAERYLTNGPTL